MTAPSVVQLADAFADEAASSFRDHHQPFVQRLEHARRVQARLVAQGVSDEAILAAARIYPILPVGRLDVPLLTLPMAFGDVADEAVGLVVAGLAEEAASQLARPRRQRRKRFPAGVRLILEAEEWCREHAATKPADAVPGRALT
jgi:hypothetical protein